MVTIPDCKREKIIKLLKHWHKDREAFTVIQVARLVGALMDIALTCPWAVFVFISLQDSLRRALRKNRTRQQDETLNVIQFNPSTTKFVDFKAKARKVKWTQSSLVKEIWKDNAKCRLNKSAKEEIKMLVTILSDKDRFKWEIPMAHMIPKEPDCESWGDACLTGGGAFSLNASFWWETKWPEETTKRTLKSFSTKKKKDSTRMDMSMMDSLTLTASNAQLSSSTMWLQLKHTRKTKMKTNHLNQSC